MSEDLSKILLTEKAQKGDIFMKMGNMQGMMQKMQKMQKDMEKEQKAIETSIFEASDNNNLVTVKVTGAKRIVELEIKEDLVDPEDIDMLQDLVIVTVNDALAQVDKATEQRLGKFTQGMPGLF